MPSYFSSSSFIPSSCFHYYESLFFKLFFFQLSKPKEKICENISKHFSFFFIFHKLIFLLLFIWEKLFVFLFVLNLGNSNTKYACLKVTKATKKATKGKQQKVRKFSSFYLYQSQRRLITNLYGINEACFVINFNRKGKQ